MAKQPLTAWVWPVKKSHSQFLVPLACPTACYLCPGSALLVLLGDVGVSVPVPPSSCSDVARRASSDLCEHNLLLQSMYCRHHWCARNIK